VLAGDVYSDAKFTGGPGDHSTDVGRGAEPQLPTEGETGGQGLRDQQPDSTVACGDGRRVVKKGAGIEHLKDLGAVPVNPFEADSSRKGSRDNYATTRCCGWAYSAPAAPSDARRW